MREYTFHFELQSGFMNECGATASISVMSDGIQGGLVAALDKADSSFKGGYEIVRMTSYVKTVPTAKFYSTQPMVHR